MPSNCVALAIDSVLEKLLNSGTEALADAGMRILCSQRCESSIIPCVGVLARIMQTLIASQTHASIFVLQHWLHAVHTLHQVSWRNL